MKKVFWAVGFLGLSVGLYVMMGLADTKTGTLVVNASIPSIVSIDTISMEFGLLSPTSETTGEGWIMVAAQPGLIYWIALDKGYGAQFGGPGDARVMFNPEEPNLEEYIQYELYQDAGRTVVWGDEGYGGTYPMGAPLGPFEGMGDWQQYIVYGKAFSYGAQREGQYADMITITVWY